MKRPSRGLKDWGSCPRIAALCQTRPINLSGRASLKQLGALSARARLFIRGNAGPMHIAAVVGTPVIALFEPAGELNWGPFGHGRVDIKQDCECRPSGKDGCQGKKHVSCLEEIAEEVAIQKAFGFLAKTENPHDRTPCGGSR
jgi:ADP-heptose:LPS heptosyltransferase